MRGATLKSQKQRAFFALLATAPLARRTRNYLQHTLWGSYSYDEGRQNLRRMLSDLRRILGPDFDRFLTCTNSDIALDLTRVRFEGGPTHGSFLKDIDLRVPNFQNWIASIRADESQIAGLYRKAPCPGLSPPMPRIAVLPFRRIWGDESLYVLGDWLAEEICRSLSRSRALFIVSHLSSRAVASPQPDIAAIRRTLGVDYFVSGSVRDIGGRCAVDMDFVDARDGSIIWSRQISASSAQGFCLVRTGLDDVVRAIGRSIADGSIAYVRDRPPLALEDHRLIVEGVSLMHRLAFCQFATSRALLLEAVSRAPKNAETHAWLARWYMLNVFNGWTADRPGDTQRALDATARALDLDPESAFALVIDGCVRTNLLRNTDVAQDSYDAALKINPNESLSWLLSGAHLAFRDEGTEAIAATVRARSLSPADPFSYYFDSLCSSAYLAAEDYESALALAQASLANNDRHVSTLRAKIVSLHHLDRGAEARATADRLRRRCPGFRLETYRKTHPAAHSVLGTKAAAALAASGLS
ncbi:hypothetical protein [Litoreibacter ponti]|nr:hypothetical protein [Litoreibacter ponti]